MTINSQLSLHTRSNIVLVLFLDRLRAFQPHSSQLLCFRSSYCIKIEYQNVPFRLFLKEQIMPFVFPVFSLSPPQRPPTVAPWEKSTRSARRLGRGKIRARGERWRPPRSRFLSPALPLRFLSLVFTNRSLCGGESVFSC